ncbi:hypothetical protein CC80DRAFT_15101 [Byssothecium circinans]|uniref:MARVEL domain-containing protein n=1 Tax=Byssothecium circinans TaxID=147558 RepID=A0A6A5U1Q5_9PLEO|nr:hypothetical protein CC80DRAFT_15101 [Byssothecium circinans]
MSAILNFPIRGAQIVFAVIVTGLSINLAHGHEWGSAPFVLGYVSFVGCITLLGALAGLAAMWVDFLQGVIGMALDGLILILNLAGGVVVAVKLDGVKCDKITDGPSVNNGKLLRNGLINGGWKKDTCYWCTQPDGVDVMLSRCKQNQADSAFMILTVIVLLVSLVLAFLRSKK